MCTCIIVMQKIVNLFADEYHLDEYHLMAQKCHSLRTEFTLRYDWQRDKYFVIKPRYFCLSKYVYFVLNPKFES